MADDEEISELGKARAKVDEAVKAFAKIYAQERGFYNIYVTSWVMSGEYTNLDLMNENQSASFLAVPTDQSPSTSIGLFEMGKHGWLKND